MKTLLKVVAVVVLFTLASCTENNEIVTKNGEVFNIQSIDKEDSTTDHSNGNPEHTMEED